MIDFSVSEETRILLDVVQRFSTTQLLPGIRSAEAARAPSRETTRIYEDLGLLGLESPADGLGLVTRCAVNEILGRGDPGAALALDRLGPAAYALRAMEEGEQSLEEIAADPSRRAWLLTPEDGALNVTERTASGEAHFAPAGVTDLVVLSPTGIALIRSGIEETPVRGAGLKAANPVRLTLAGAPVARFRHVPTAPVLARARLYVASLLLGVLEAASSYARNYALERVAFGRPIAHHQALTFLLIDMNTAVTGTRLLIQEAAWRVDTGHAAEEAAATAFAETVEQSAFVAPNGVQILGGLGFMQDYPVEKYMRESRALGLLYGGLDHARNDAMQHHATTSLMAQGLF